MRLYNTWLIPLETNYSEIDVNREPNSIKSKQQSAMTDGVTTRRSRFDSSPYTVSKVRPKCFGKPLSEDKRFSTAFSIPSFSMPH